jgi:hypothetical protein
MIMLRFGMITWKATVMYFGDHNTKLDEVCGVTENTIYIHVLDEHGEPPFFQSLYLFICSFDLWKKGDFNISLMWQRLKALSCGRSCRSRRSRSRIWRYWFGQHQDFHVI